MERTGVLLLRVWVDDHDPATLRARITQRAEAEAPDETVVLAVGVANIEAAVGDWLTLFATQSN